MSPDLAQNVISKDINQALYLKESIPSLNIANIALYATDNKLFLLSNETTINSKCSPTCTEWYETDSR